MESKLEQNEQPAAIDSESSGLVDRVGQDLANDLATGAATLSAHLPPVESPPVAAQPHAPSQASKLQSEKVVVAAPLSFAGSAARIWKLVRLRPEPAARAGLGILAVLLIVVAWTCVLAWYAIFGLLLVPYRMVRRGSRQRKRQALQHREMMAAVQGRQDPPKRD